MKHSLVENMDVMGTFKTVISYLTQKIDPDDWVSFSDIVSYAREILPAFTLLPKAFAAKEVKNAIKFGLKKGIISREHGKFKIKSEISTDDSGSSQCIPPAKCAQCGRSGGALYRMHTNEKCTLSRSAQYKKRKKGKPSRRNKSSKSGRRSHARGQKRRKLYKRRKRRSTKVTWKKKEYSPKPGYFPEPMDEKKEESSDLKISMNRPDGENIPNMIIKNEAMDQSGMEMLTDGTTAEEIDI